jgi:hypothetical protein
MVYQCRRVGDSDAERNFQQVQALNAVDASIYHIHRLFSLPHVEDISGFLVSGQNIINIRSDNSGLGDCHLRTGLDLTTTTSPKATYTIEISPDQGKPNTADQSLQPNEVFLSGGSAETGEANDSIPIYETSRSNGSYRLCQRISILFNLSTDQLRTFDAHWDLWAQRRRREIICSILADRPEYCRT